MAGEILHVIAREGHLFEVFLKILFEVRVFEGDGVIKTEIVLLSFKNPRRDEIGRAIIVFLQEFPLDVLEFDDDVLCA